MSLSLRNVSNWRWFRPRTLMKLTVFTTSLITWSICSVLQHNTSWCKIQWNAQNSCPPFAVCTLSRNFVATPVFLPTIDGAPSVARLTARDQSAPTLERWKCHLLLWCHGHQFKQLLGDGQSFINTSNEYGQLSNICDIGALIYCNWKCDKWLDFSLSVGFSSHLRVLSPDLRQCSS